MSDVQLRPTDKLIWHEEQIRIPLPPTDVYARLATLGLRPCCPALTRFRQ
jgi:hypothetical protein